MIVTSTLQHLDLVAIGVLDKKEPREQFAVSFKFFDGGGRPLQVAEALELLIEIIDHEGGVPVACAVCS